MNPSALPAAGGCACARVRYELRATPMFTHCCHCRWCQRETGSAFVINALVETASIAIIAGAPTPVDTPSESGRGQKIVRCPNCQVALWSFYTGIGPKVAFLRAGCLDNPDRIRPDIHIFTASRQPWVTLNDDIPIKEEYYRRSEEWPAEALERLRIARGG